MAESPKLGQVQVAEEPKPQRLGRQSQISFPINETRPYLTRHLPNSYRRRVKRLSQYYGTSQEEMMNCTIAHGLAALEKIKESENN